MATGSDIDLHASEADFASLYSALLALKANTDDNGAVLQYDENDADERAVADWGNWVDDAIRTLQRTSRLVYRGSADPNGSQAAALGSIYLRTGAGSVDRVYSKESEAAPDDDTGWVAIVSASSVSSDVLYDMDWSAFADDTLANGANVIDSIEWTGANLPLLGSVAIEEDTGLILTAGAGLGSVSTFTSSAQSTPHLYVPLEDIPNYDPRFDLIAEAYFSTITAENSGEGVFIGVWGPTAVPSSTSAARVRWAGLFNSGGSRVLRSTSQTTAVSTDDTRAGHNVIGFRLTPNGIGHTWSGIYAAGFPTLIVPGTTFPTLVADDDPMSAAGVRFFISAATVNDASPTSSYVLERLVFRRAG